MIESSRRKRLNAIASTLQVCQKHGTPLVCCGCWFFWDGTEAEFWALRPLAARAEPYCPHPPPSGQTCAMCGQAQYCELCAAVLDDDVLFPEELFTADELDTYAHLMGKLRRRDTPKPNGWHEGFTATA
jgi:hypothetical protein